ncbi:MAG: NAD+ synthase [Candidatus Omnitrophota bacterium]
MPNLRVAIAQINCKVGDLKANSGKIIDYCRMASDKNADIVVFPELAVTGYPPEDLLFKPSFIKDNHYFLNRIKQEIPTIVAVLGFVGGGGREIFNSAAVIYKKKLCGVYNKLHLPNYSVFDEKRYFKPDGNYQVFKMDGVRFAVLICEDIWEREPIAILSRAGAQAVLVLNASPYHLGKIEAREAMLRKCAKENRLFLAYANLIGGQDELVFDGRSMVINDRGRLVAQGKAFVEELLIADLTLPVKKISKRLPQSVIPKQPKTQKEFCAGKTIKKLSVEEEVYLSLKLGLRDYVEKNHFHKVVIGLSGGVDSALTATIAVDALGRERVCGVFMPSEFSSQLSYEDASRLAENLGIDFKVINIQEVFEVYKKTLAPFFAGLAPDVAEENLQARIRGNLLMAFSNKFGWLVLTTGNKSEYSCGYATLYGDMAGGFAVIKDVPKTLVSSLARFRNRIGEKEVIPQRTITREPSAELRPNQKDSDSLPPYPLLDKIIALYVEGHRSRHEIVKKLPDSKTVDKVIRLIDRAEYKRRQSPPGVKITPLAFGKDWRMPITNGYSS